MIFTSLPKRNVKDIGYRAFLIYLHIFYRACILELGMEALAEIQKRFYADFPPRPDEKKYNFATPFAVKF